MKNNTFKTTIIAAILGIVLAVSSGFAISSLRANAATTNKPVSTGFSEKTTHLNVFSNAYYFKAAGKCSKGYDWSFKADNKNIKVKCAYDFKSHKYTFKFKGTSYGLTKLTLKYKVSDTKTAKVHMTLFVDPQNYIMRTA